MKKSHESRTDSLVNKIPDVYSVTRQTLALVDFRSSLKIFADFSIFSKISKSMAFVEA